MVGTWCRITTVTSILSVCWSWGSSTVCCTSESQALVVYHNGHVRQLCLWCLNSPLDLLDVSTSWVRFHELCLWYLNSLQDPLYGRHLSRCRDSDFGGPVGELWLLGFQALSGPSAPVMWSRLLGSLASLSPRASKMRLSTPRALLL